MLAEMPDSRISGKPTIAATIAAAEPPASVPASTGHSADARNAGRSGRNTPFAAVGMVSRAET